MPTKEKCDQVQAASMDALRAEIYKGLLDIEAGRIVDGVAAFEAVNVRLDR